MRKYKKYQVVRIKLVHDEQVLKRLKTIGLDEDLIIKNDELLLFIKPRPAIVISSFSSKAHGETRYLVIPLTTKRSIANYYGAEYPLRIEIYDSRFKVRHNYLMIDNMLTLSESFLKPELDDEGKIILLGNSEIKRIKAELLERVAYLLNLIDLLKTIEKSFNK